MKQTFTAKTVEEAVSAASESFKVSAEKIKVTVLEEPKKGFLGIVKGEAKIEAEYEPSKGEIAADYISKVMTAMGFETPQISVEENESGAALVISGNGAEGIIGKRGEVIDAVQYLSSLVCNKNSKDYYRISLDCGGFRAKRKVQLEELAKKIAANVKKSGRTTALEPMNPYERRIIHAAVSEIEGVTSRSVGEEPYRKVLISSTEKKPYNSEKGGFRKSGSRNDGEKRSRRRDENYTPQRKEFDISSSFEKDYKRPKPEDEMESGLYSKIEV